MAYFDCILVTMLTVDFNRENGGLVFQPFLDFIIEIYLEDGHFLAISVFIIVTGLKPQNKKQFRVRLYRQFWEKFIDMSQNFVDSRIVTTINVSNITSLSWYGNLFYIVDICWPYLAIKLCGLENTI